MSRPAVWSSRNHFTGRDQRGQPSERAAKVCQIPCMRARNLIRGPAVYSMMALIGSPSTSVSRKSRPWKRYVNCS